MRKVIIVVATSVFLAGVIMVLVIRNFREPLSTQLGGQTKDEIDTILDQLVFVPRFPTGNESYEDRMAISEANKKGWNQMTNAGEKLRRLGTNALPRLMEEVRIAGRIEATNRMASSNATMRVVEAFGVLGRDAKQSLPELVEEFYSGRSVWPSVGSIARIGGTDAGFFFVSALTNPNPYSCYAVMSRLANFKTNREVALAAVPPLLVHLHDESAFSRALAASVLGSLEVKPEQVVPTLLQIAENDPDSVVRITAIQAIGHYGTNAISAKPNLEAIVVTGQPESIRRIASIAISAIEGQITPKVEPQ